MTASSSLASRVFRLDFVRRRGLDKQERGAQVVKMYRVLLLLLLLAGAPEALSAPVHLPVAALLSSQEEPDRYHLLQQLSHHTTEGTQAQPDLWLREVPLALPAPKVVAALITGYALPERAAHHNQAPIQLAPKNSPPSTDTSRAR